MQKLLESISEWASSFLPNVFWPPHLFPLLPIGVFNRASFHIKNILFSENMENKHAHTPKYTKSFLGTKLNMMSYATHSE